MFGPIVLKLRACYGRRRIRETFFALDHADGLGHRVTTSETAARHFFPSSMTPPMLEAAGILPGGGSFALAGRTVGYASPGQQTTIFQMQQSSKRFRSVRSW
jgi:hypothetical protein